MDANYPKKPSEDRDPDADPPTGQPMLPWPVCPDCGRRRQTRCPSCDLGNDDFPLADMFFAPRREPPGKCSACGPLDPCGLQNPDDKSGVMLMCPGCEEAFRPEFYRYCQQCGHDFGHGLWTAASEPDELTDRALLVLGGLIALFVAIMVYFWLLIGRPAVLGCG